MRRFEKGNMTYVLIIILIILASVVLAGGFRAYNIHFLDKNDTPVDNSLPGSYTP